MTCGDGTRTSNRYVIQVAEYGGEQCIGDTTKIDSCNMGECLDLGALSLPLPLFT